MPAFRPFMTAASLVALLAAPALAQAPAPGPIDPPPAAAGHRAMPHHAAKLSVTGHGRASAEPDLARITLGVSTEAPTAEEAMSQNSGRQQAVIDALKAEGIEARDIQTAGLSLSPKMVYNNNEPPRMTGYVAQNTVNIRVRDIEGLGSVLDRLVSTGANEISGISFAREDMTEAEDEARADAVADARRRAEQMATAADMKLGPIRMLSEGGAAPGPRPLMAMRAEAKSDAAVPIAAGELEVTAEVSAVFDMLPAEGEPSAPEPVAPETPEAGN